jgi:diacylglycerol kinase family enzyme
VSGDAGHVRVLLLYNENAGEGLPLDLIREAIVRHGHELVRVIEKDTDIDGLVAEASDLVVAAGGDGTIAMAARLLAGRGIPLAILPLGTANNIAKSLGIDESFEQTIARWSTARRRPLDLGIARSDWGDRRFVEAVGGGLIPGGIVHAKLRSVRDQGPSTSRIFEAVRRYGQVLSRLEPAPWTIDVDGVRTTGEFLLVEVLNIRSIGPNLVLAADADPSDGLFSVVMAGEEHREELVRYLESRLEDREQILPLLSRHGQHIALRGGTEVHVDDQILPSSGTVSIDVEAGALEVLA